MSMTPSQSRWSACGVRRGDILDMDVEDREAYFLISSRVQPKRVV